MLTGVTINVIKGSLLFFNMMSFQEFRDHINMAIYKHYVRNYDDEELFFPITPIRLPKPFNLYYHWFEFHIFYINLWKDIIIFPSHFSIWLLSLQIIKFIWYLLFGPILIFLDFIGLWHLFYMIIRIYHYKYLDLGFYDFDRDYVPYIIKFIENEINVEYLWESIRYFGWRNFVEDVTYYSYIGVKPIHIWRMGIWYFGRNITDEGFPIPYMIRSYKYRKHHFISHIFRSLYKIFRGILRYPFDCIVLIFDCFLDFVHVALFYWFFYENYLYLLILRCWANILRDKAIQIVSLLIKLIIFPSVLFVYFIIIDFFWWQFVIRFLRWRKARKNRLTNDTKGFYKRTWREAPGEGETQIHYLIYIIYLTKASSIFNFCTKKMTLGNLFRTLTKILIKILTKIISIFSRCNHIFWEILIFLLDYERIIMLSVIQYDTDTETLYNDPSPDCNVLLDHPRTCSETSYPYPLDKLWNKDLGMVVGRAYYKKVDEVQEKTSRQTWASVVGNTPHKELFFNTFVGYVYEDIKVDGETSLGLWMGYLEEDESSSYWRWRKIMDENSLQRWKKRRRGFYKKKFTKKEEEEEERRFIVREAWYES